MLAEQIKKRAPFEARNHFIDQWTDLIDPEVLARKLNEYEAVRRPVEKSLEKKNQDRKIYGKGKFERKNTDEKQRDAGRPTGTQNEETNWRNEGNQDKNESPLAITADQNSI